MDEKAAIECMDGYKSFSLHFIGYSDMERLTIIIHLNLITYGVKKKICCRQYVSVLGFILRAVLVPVHNFLFLGKPTLPIMKT